MTVRGDDDGRVQLERHQEPAGASKASGCYLHRPKVDTHRCDPPKCDWLRWSRGHPAGTVWQCPCGQVWHVVSVPAVVYGNRVTVAHNEWQRETRRQRRRRLGLHWWRRESR